MNTKTLTAIALAALAGCAQQPPLTADEVAHLEPVVCRGPVQCKSMWERAQLWIAQNAAMKLQLVTDVVLQTYSPPEQSSMRLSYTITKEPIGNDAYQISAVAGCRNPYGCTAPPLLARARIHQYIRQTPQ